MDQNKFAPRVNQTKMEKTGERNSDYSAWLRTLGQEFLAVDIDFVIHDTNLSIFHVHDLSESLDTFKRMSQDEYGKFIKNL